jgi:hypothetical protein
MKQTNSHLFTLRVWSEIDEDGAIRWRGKLCHVPSGNIRHFRGWSALVPLLLDTLRRYPNETSDPDPAQDQTC